eukprot:jgi/Ulvmu1/2196/UM013_0042.1
MLHQSAIRTTPCTFARGRSNSCSSRPCKRLLSCRSKTGFESEFFGMDSAPLLIPDGEGAWEEIPGAVLAPRGFKGNGMYSGMRAGSKADLALVVCEEGAVAAGAFTQNVMCAAPVTVCKQVLASNSSGVKAVLTNAGQANAATGDAGMADAVASQEKAAQELGCDAGDVLIMSTGVIGRRIKLDALQAALPALAGNLGTGNDCAQRAAVAITTTDLVSKSCAVEVDLGGAAVRLGGMAKGSGMIHPNMATMLALLTCDAAVAPDVWSAMLKRAVTRSFNAITVDGDTSTNDTVLALASGAAGNDVIADAGAPAAQRLEAAMTAVLQGLAKAIAWDGEGATCLLEVTCVGAASADDALLVAKSVASSSLAKAAIFGHDPNWGRLACAAGYSGADFSQEDLGVKLGPFTLMEKGQPLDFDAAAASGYLKEVTGRHGTVEVGVRIGEGPASGQAWGCDLSYDYVRINAEYTT